MSCCESRQIVRELICMGRFISSTAAADDYEAGGDISGLVLGHSTLNLLLCYILSYGN
jgi:hypothetical protein